MKILLSTTLYILFFSAFTFAQEQAQVWSTGQWLTFNCQTIGSLDDYIEDPNNLELSKYGGWEAHQVAATGFFRVEQIDGRWWVIDPEGYLYIHKALNSVNLNNHSPDEIFQFLSEYGFNGMGCWSDEDILKSSLKESTPIAYCPKYSFIAMYRRTRNPRIEMPVFDDEFETFAKSAADYFMPYKDDPQVFGYFSDNELSWRDDGLPAHLAITDHTDNNYIAAVDFLQSRGKTPDNWTQDDQYEYMAVMAERYYSIVSSAIKAVDPNHMYIGTRCHSTERFIPNFMKNAGKYVDIFSSNRYNRWGERKVELDNMTEWSGRPMIISEFYAMEQIPDNTGAGWEVRSQADRGPFYQNFVTTFLENRNVVGFHWFKFEDQADPVSNKGVVNNDGEPYTELLTYMQELNEHIYDYIDYVDSRENPDYVLYPEADAYYKNTTNYGTDPELLVKAASSVKFTRDIYMRFDISSIHTPVESAKIRLNALLESSESGQYQAELVSDNTWTETGITIDNSPDGSTVLATWGRGDDIKFDVTDELKDALSKDKKLSIRIVSTLNNGSIPSYGSREHSNPNARPTLIIVGELGTNMEISNTKKSALRIYPNPCSDIINISRLVEKVEIMDITGMHIRTIHSPVNSIDVSGLKQGSYIFRAANDGNVYNQNIIKF